MEKNKLQEIVEEQGISIEDDLDMLEELGEPETVYDVEG